MNNDTNNAAGTQTTVYYLKAETVLTAYGAKWVEDHGRPTLRRPAGSRVTLHVERNDDGRTYYTVAERGVDGLTYSNTTMRDADGTLHPGCGAGFAARDLVLV